MFFLVVYYGDNPECIEGFSETCKRSCVGALHLRPKKSLTVTEDELNHIKSARKDVAAKLKVVANKPPVSEIKVEVSENVAVKVTDAKPVEVVNVDVKPDPVLTDARTISKRNK